MLTRALCPAQTKGKAKHCAEVESHSMIEPLSTHLRSVVTRSANECRRRSMQKPRQAEKQRVVHQLSGHDRRQLERRGAV